MLKVPDIFQEVMNELCNGLVEYIRGYIYDLLIIINGFKQMRKKFSQAKNSFKSFPKNRFSPDIANLEYLGFKISRLGKMALPDLLKVKQ